MGIPRALIESVVQTGKTAQFGRQLAVCADYEIKRAAGEAVMLQAQWDPLNSRRHVFRQGLRLARFA